jgi:hypothetical protein
MLPVMVAAGWSEAQRRAYTLADNKLALNAGWDAELLKLELDGLQALDFDLELTGFSFDEIAGLTLSGVGLTDPDLSGVGLTDPDDSPEIPPEPVSEPGDVWLLGRHRLVCGDCTDADVVGKALNGVKPHLMVTDQPYGVEYDANWRNGAARDGAAAGRKRGVIGHVGARKNPMGNGAISARAIGKVENDDRADWREAWSLFPGDVAYAWCASLTNDAVVASLRGRRHRSPDADYLGEIAFHDRAWRLSLATRVLLVRGAQRRDRTLVWRSDSNHALANRQAAEVRDRPQHAEARRVHEAADREQQLARPGGLRSIRRLRHDNHCRRDDRAGVPRDRNTSGICRLRGDPMAEFHGPRSDAGIDQQDICRDEAGSLRWFQLWHTFEARK